jgi:hypothetical protein
MFGSHYGARSGIVQPANLARVNLALVARLTTLQVGVEDAAAVIDVLCQQHALVGYNSFPAELKAAAL